MAARVVKAGEVRRFLLLLKECEIVPSTFDLIPGGVVRIHSLPPHANDDAKEGANEWDAALKD
tara:strand:- start:387 stop:575 length:189 start_codon:yes stop_codon:yes gene_type:complete